MPKGVICLASALAFHGLPDQMPPKVWIAVGRKAWRPRLTYPPTRIARFTVEPLRRSVEHKRIAGTRVPVYGVAKTVADLFRYRRTVGDSIAIEGLRQAQRRRKATPAEIAREAAAAGVWGTMVPYVMALTRAARSPAQHQRLRATVFVEPRACALPAHGAAHAQCAGAPAAPTDRE